MKEVRADTLHEAVMQVLGCPEGEATRLILEGKTTVQKVCRSTFAGVFKGNIIRVGDAEGVVVKTSGDV
jgi:hypothetical protein